MQLISVQVNLHTILQKQTPQGPVSIVQYQCKPGQTISQLMAAFSVEYTQDNLLLVVNGQVKTVDYLLEDGDEVHLIPAISGG